MADRRQLDPALGVVLVGVGLACGGWVSASAPLAIAGMLVVLLALLVWAWGRWCLESVSYVRTLEHRRATFGERLAVEIEIVNDKLLPLAWLHVRDGCLGHCRWKARL